MTPVPSTMNPSLCATGPLSVTVAPAVTMDTEAVSILACNARINEGKLVGWGGVAVEKSGFTEDSYTSEGLVSVNAT
jgi:hypothetical protein